MRELATKLCDHLLNLYGDIGFVTPAAFANGLRAIANLPEDATPLHFELFIRPYVDVRVGSPDLAGFNYDERGRGVIETGRGRSIEERNITIPHEFGERLRNAMNEELAVRGVPGIDWPDHAWDTMAVELVSPLAAFRRKAQENGVDLIDLAKPLSYEAVVRQTKSAFDETLPLFAAYYRNNGQWESGRGFSGSVWIAAQSAWTKKWLGHAYASGRELLPLPRRTSPLREGSLVDDVRRTRRALLVHARSEVHKGALETDILIRTRSYGRDVAQVFVVGVAKSFSHILTPQLQLVGPDERHAAFEAVF